MKQFVVPVQKDAGLEATVELDNWVIVELDTGDHDDAGHVNRGIAVGQEVSNSSFQAFKLIQQLPLNISADKLLSA